MMTADPSDRLGTLFVVVGPSGAGKDSLISESRKILAGNPQIGFVRRVITRPSDGVTEDHVAVTDAEFQTMSDAGAFAVQWRAHGLSYGIPVATLDELTAGVSLIVNGSREHLADFARTYDKLIVLHVTASPEIIGSRLAARGRESAEDIMRRMARQTQDWQIGLQVETIENSGDLHDAAHRFVDAIRNAQPDLTAPIAV
jgi:phosphonate metabolism protein PhnN/1,5-bisphosphokinase (PRPP-forming)